MKCTCKNNKTHVELSFDINNPETMQVFVSNEYVSGLSMVNILDKRKELHAVLDKVLDKISVEIFSMKVKELEKGGN